MVLFNFDILEGWRLIKFCHPKGVVWFFDIIDECCNCLYGST